MGIIRFQLLTCEVEIAVDDAAVIDALRYLVQDAIQDIRPHAHVRYDVQRGAGGFRVLEDGTEIGADLDPSGVLHLVYPRAHEAAHRSLPPHMRVHAGCATIDGKRVLIVGGKGAGKTTLTLRLAHDGVDVHSDETALIHADGQSIPFPRRFHVRSGTFSLIPEMAGREGTFPYADSPRDGRIYGIAPSDWGRPWRLTSGQIDAIVYLKRNHGGDTRVVEIKPEAALKRLRRHVTFPERSVQWFSTLFGVVNRARNIVLINGDPVAAATSVKHLWAGCFHTGGSNG